MDKRWLAGRELSPHAEFRLFCLPYAGGGAAIYRRWHEIAPDHIQVCPVELPGRGSRIREIPFARLAPLVQALADALDGALDRPFAIFGHSMGGLLAFELTRTLNEWDRPRPAHLFVSATAAPGTPPSRPLIHRAADEDVKKQLRSLNGTPLQLLEDEELMALMLPTLRADFSVIETYEYREGPPLATAITVFGGMSDPVVPPSSLNGWRRQSRGDFRLQLFPGDHFFVHAALPNLMEAIAHALARGTAPQPSRD